MIYFKISSNNNEIVVSQISNTRIDCDYVTRNDMRTFEYAQQLANAASKFASELYIPIDRGQFVSPRFDVILAPKVGEKISHVFNGDYYPDGEIATISKTMKKITSTTGKSYYRKANSGLWIYDKTWAMVAGHHSQKNPSF